MGAPKSLTAKEEKDKKPSLLPRQNGDTLWERLTEFYLIPEGYVLGTWDRFMVAASLCNAVLLTYMAAFQYHSAIAWAGTYLLDIIFFCDIYIKFHIAFLQDGFWVVFPKQMALHYLHSHEFIFDLVTNLPTDLIAITWAGQSASQGQTYLAIVRLWKCFRTGRVLIYFRRQEQKLHASFLIQVTKFITFLSILTHCIACIWFAISCSGEIEWPEDASTIDLSQGQCRADG
ncbi:hypothetical protein BDK51DRAFT_31732, partial [Blyttiomyces helicus]